MSNSRIRTPLKDQGARSPVDRTAALVTSRGVEFDPNLPETSRQDSDLPIQTAPVPLKIQDLTGLRLGRLTVVGYHSTSYRHNSAKTPRRRWVCRCACGWYTIRLAASLTRGKNPDECCDRCEYLKQIQKGDKFKGGEFK